MNGDINYYVEQHLAKEIGSNMFGSDVLTEIYVKQILVLANRLSDNYTSTNRENIMPRLVMDTMTYIERHITEDITLDIIADIIHHNANYISRTFKKASVLLYRWQYVIRQPEDFNFMAM